MGLPVVQQGRHWEKSDIVLISTMKQQLNTESLHLLWYLRRVSMQGESFSDVLADVLQHSIQLWHCICVQLTLLVGVNLANLHLVTTLSLKYSHSSLLGGNFKKQQKLAMLHETNIFFKLSNKWYGIPNLKERAFKIMAFVWSEGVTFCVIHRRMWQQFENTYISRENYTSG